MSPVSFRRICNSAMLTFPQQRKVTLVAPWQLIVHSCGVYRLWLFVHVPPSSYISYWAAVAAVWL